MIRRLFSGSIKTVGFLGVGKMGTPMALHLSKCGFRVTAYDINPAPLGYLAVQGVNRAASAQEAAKGADAVVLALPGCKEVEHTVRGPQGVAEVMKPGAILIDCTTISPFISIQLSEELRAKGIDFLDAPTSGGTIGAKLGTLTIMVGGPEPAIAKSMPLLKAMGKNIIHCGGSGTGLVLRLCNSLCLASVNLATCEAMNLGIQMGLDKKVLFDVMSVSTARCWPLDTSNPVPDVLPAAPSSRHYDGGFSTESMLKDLILAIGIAEKCQAQALLGEEALKVYQQAAEAGASHKDFGILYQFISHNYLK